MSDGLLKCLSCAAVLQPNDDKKYLECEYCGTHNANFSKFEVLDLNSTNDGSENLTDLEKLAVHLKHRDYKSLREDADLFLRTHPKSWIAMVYKAIGEFWTGYNDFSHMDGVMVLINRAMDTSNRNEFVLNGFNQIANNCLIICAKNKKYYGNDLKESIIIFNYFYNENIDESNKKLVKEYCSKAFNKYKNDLNKLVDSSSDYDPPYIAIENLYHLACITEELEIQEFYYAHAQRHISLNDKKTYINTLKTNFNKVKGDLENKGIDTNSIKLNCKESSFSSDGCFVATAAFGDYNHPIVLDLRKFRDESLSGTKLGDIFIKNYYKYSPYLAKFISNSLVLKLLTVYLVLKPIHIMIKKGDR